MNFCCRQEQVLQLGNIRGVDEGIFVTPEKLHITVGVMVLDQDSDVLKASELLIDSKTEIIE